MRKIKFKSNVRISEFSRPLEIMLAAVRKVQKQYKWIPDEVWITSINDSNHMPGSRHFKDEAIDIRSHNFENPADKFTFVEMLSFELNKDRNQFSVLFEGNGTANEHFHVQVKKGHVFKD